MHYLETLSILWSDQARHAYQRCAPGRVICFMTHTKIPYNGKAASLEDQILLLKQAGVLIKDEELAKNCLSFIGYYRLFAYVKPFLNRSSIKPHIDFDQIWNLYIFDRKLRLLVIDAIERIEVAFRVSISEIMSTQYDPFWYTNNGHFKHIKWHIEFMDKVLNLINRQEHTLIKHFYNTYSSPDFPPSWIITECLTFGVWSKVFDNLKKRGDKIAIANKLNMRLMRLLSWIRCLTELRNLCAHHERIWNHFFRHTPKDVPSQPHQDHTFYQQAYIIGELLKVISPTSGWKNKLRDLMEEYSDLPLEKTGFSSRLDTDPFWTA